jgi:hypothetical protein
MNVSWNDINRVQESGQYPFRDGTITVTFAEIAVWKERPDAQWTAPLNVVCYNATTLWHFDAAEWAPSTASFATETRCPRYVRFSRREL